MIPVIVEKRPKPTAKLSTRRLDPQKFSSPFSHKGKRTAFAEAYARGDIPCRIEHHTSKLSLIWTIPLESMCLKMYVYPC